MSNTEEEEEEEELTTISMSAISPRPREDSEVFQSSVGNLSIRIIGVSCSLPLERAPSTGTSSKMRCNVQPGLNSIKPERKECCKENRDFQRNLQGNEQIISTSDKLRESSRKNSQEKDHTQSQEPPFLVFEPGTLNFRTLLETGVIVFLFLNY